jgi:uncharacterized glyoxalase superfamily protein PhnB
VSESQPRLDQIDLIVPDAAAAGVEFARLVGVEANVIEANFAEITVGAVTVMFSPNAMFALPGATGTILHLKVPDPDAEAQRLRGLGAEIILGPVDTDWGTRALYVQGPGAVIDFYCLTS